MRASANEREWKRAKANENARVVNESMCQWNEQTGVGYCVAPFIQQGKCVATDIISLVKKQGIKNQRTMKFESSDAVQSLPRADSLRVWNQVWSHYGIDMIDTVDSAKRKKN